MTDNEIISVKKDNYVKLSKLKKYNPNRKGKTDTYDDVITRLLKSQKNN